MLPLRPNVCMIILNKKDKIFLGERYGKPGIWQLPQGGLDSGESVEDGALREAKEELGVPRKTLTFERVLKEKNEYEFTTVPKYAKGIWRGQSQSFCVLRFKGKDSDINLAKYDQEFMDFKWVTPKEIRKLAEPIRFKGYKLALKEL